MTTHVSTHVTRSNPARSDLAELDPTPTLSRSWSLAGIAAGLLGIATVMTSGMVNAVYDPDLAGDPDGIVDKLGDQVGAMLAFHTVTMLGAVLLLVFAAGLFRRLRATVAVTSLVPMVAFAGVVGTSIVSILGAGLDTEFIFGLSDDKAVDPANAALYNHWIGTIPWIWVLAGLSGLAVFVASRAGAVPRWIGLVGLVLGGLTLLLGISPLQYMAGMVGPVWLLVTAVGFHLGDRAFRR